MQADGSLRSALGVDVSSTVSVLIAEDHAVVREGTRKILEAESGIEVVGEAADGAEALKLAAALQPDVLLVDVRMPIMDGLEVARQIRSVAPQTKVVILSAHEDDRYIFAAMEAGASGYLLKTAKGSEVASAVRSVAMGQTILHESVVKKIASYWLRGRSPPEASEQPRLTAREQQVLQLVARGMQNREIAAELNVVARTVEGHLSHIFNKTGAESRTEALVYGLSKGWIELEDDQNEEPA